MCDRKIALTREVLFDLRVTGWSRREAKRPKKAMMAESEGDSEERPPELQIAVVPRAPSPSRTPLPLDQYPFA